MDNTASQKLADRITPGRAPRGRAAEGRSREPAELLDNFAYLEAIRDRVRMRCVNKATAFTSGEVCEADFAPLRKKDYQTFVSKVAREHE